MIEQDLVTRLNADVDVAALVGTRVYSAPMPEKATLPAVQWQLIGDTSDRVAAGVLNYRRARIQVTAWDEERLTAINTATAVRNCLDGWQSSAVHMAWVTNEVDLFDSTFNPARHGRALDVVVIYKEQ